VAATSPGGGVPEPASWAMMLVGFGGLGGVLRAQRRRRSFAAA
jgi:PEP-CTERM motif